MEKRVNPYVADIIVWVSGLVTGEKRKVVRIVPKDLAWVTGNASGRQTEGSVWGKLVSSALTCGT